MYAIEACNLVKRFEQHIVLDNVSMQLESGKIYGLIGDNGSGKSVLLKCLCGILPCDSGTIRILGKEIHPGGAHQPFVGLVIEHPSFLNSMSGWHNLKYLAGIRGTATDAAIQEALSDVGLMEVAKKQVKKYSLGMRQKLAIAQALMEKPELYIMDEPFNGLDKASTDAVRQLFCKLRTEGKTMLLVSHHAEDIESLCDDVYEIQQGIIRKC